MTDRLRMVNAQTFLDRLASGLALGPTIEYATGQEFACRCFVQAKAIVTVHSLAWRDQAEEGPVVSEATHEESEGLQTEGNGEPQGLPTEQPVFRLGQGQPWPPHRPVETCIQEATSELYNVSLTTPFATPTTSRIGKPSPPPIYLHARHNNTQCPYQQ